LSFVLQLFKRDGHPLRVAHDGRLYHDLLNTVISP
jgi:hypothetical protein